jgi:hemoglobin
VEVDAGIDVEKGATGKVRIAILGAGRVGGSLGLAWAAKGHDVIFAARHVDDAKVGAAVAATGGRARSLSVNEAVVDADVVVLALPFESIDEALEGTGALFGKVVIDCTNPGAAPLPPGVGSGAEHVARLLPEARVTKAFNAQGAENNAEPRYGEAVATNFYCGDDKPAKEVVRQLVRDVGFDPVDVGPLQNARLLESAARLWFAASGALGTRRVAFCVLRSPQEKPIPSLFEWIGGLPAIERLFEVFYGRVPSDPLLAPVFAQMSPDHVKHVAAFVAEVFGGPKTYSQQLGGHANMIHRHVNRALNESQRARWMQLLLQCADDIGVPNDPEFRSALVGYLEWGTRLALINSQPDADISGQAPMPKWGWGEVKGPYVAS